MSVAFPQRGQATCMTGGGGGVIVIQQWDRRSIVGTHSCATIWREAIVETLLRNNNIGSRKYNSDERRNNIFGSHECKNGLKSTNAIKLHQCNNDLRDVAWRTPLECHYFREQNANPFSYHRSSKLHKKELKKISATWEYFCFWLATLMIPGHTIAQGQIVTYCKSGSVEAHLCRVCVALY
jgi:hypothetical protein